MDLQVCADANESAEAVDAWLKGQLKGDQQRSVYVPAGATPKPLYALWRRTRPEYLASVQLFQIDDVITGRQSRCFQKFLSEELRPWKKQIHWITTAEDQAGIAILGLGLNGHIAFHEPGLPSDFYSGCVKLTSATVSRLHLETDTWGVTYGLAAFLKCRAVVMLVSGEEKRPVLQRLLEGNQSLPASQLKSHKQFLIIADRSAAGTLPVSR